MGHGKKSRAKHPFTQVNVFSADPLGGNPLAVVQTAEGLSEAQMAALARWTNLSETTFLLSPTDSGADYCVRIFTPGGELPFAGHPTLGSCHAWLAAGGKPRKPNVVVQQCGVGLVRVRCDGPRLEFAAPPLLRTGALESKLLVKIAKALALLPSDIVHHQWVDNGPGWCAVMLRSARQVHSLKPDWASLAIGTASAAAMSTALMFTRFITPPRKTSARLCGRLGVRFVEQARRRTRQVFLRRSPGHRAPARRPRPSAQGRRRSLGRRRRRGRDSRRGQSLDRTIKVGQQKPWSLEP